MHAAWTRGGRESGGFGLKVIVIFVLLGTGMTLAFRVGPDLYQFMLMRDLADRVTREYARLPVEEVRRRVAYEMNRSQLPEEAFSLVKTTKGYRVEVEQAIPLAVTLGEKSFSLPGREEWVLRYKSES